MNRFECPYLGREVELTDEREKHIGERHPDLLPEHRPRMAETLLDPGEVRLSARFGDARLFSRWYEEIRGGKHLVVVVVSEAEPVVRDWVITAYLARRLVGGTVEWKRS